MPASRRTFFSVTRMARNSSRPSGIRSMFTPTITARNVAITTRTSIVATSRAAGISRWSAVWRSSSRRDRRNSRPAPEPDEIAAPKSWVTTGQLQRI